VLILQVVIACNGHFSSGAILAHAFHSSLNCNLRRLYDLGGAELILEHLKGRLGWL
jgi:hypothetical protein